MINDCNSIFNRKKTNYNNLNDLILHILNFTLKIQAKKEILTLFEINFVVLH